MKEPPALQRRPHHGAYPIPWIVQIEDGLPDFRVHVTERRLLVARDRLCQLCGEPMGETVTFIGTLRSLRRRLFAEPPAHRSCLDYAIAVCPWLGGAEISGRAMNAFVAERAPDTTRLAVYTCRDFGIAGSRHDHGYWVGAPVREPELFVRGENEPVDPRLDEAPEAFGRPGGAK